jgi:hypothetical protein
VYDFRLEHVHHPNFWKDDHVATLERNGVRLEVVGFGRAEDAGSSEFFKSEERSVKLTHTMTQPLISEQQREVDSILRQARMGLRLWLTGIYSYRAILGARQALKLIRESNGKLEGESQAKFIEIMGILGLVIWIPLIVVSIVISIVTR